MKKSKTRQKKDAYSGVVLLKSIKEENEIKKLKGNVRKQKEERELLKNLKEEIDK